MLSKFERRSVMMTENLLSLLIAGIPKASMVPFSKIFKRSIRRSTTECEQLEKYGSTTTRCRPRKSLSQMFPLYSAATSSPDPY